MATLEDERGAVWAAGFMLRQLTELSLAMRPLRAVKPGRRAAFPALMEEVDFTQLERRLLQELSSRRESGESFSALAADLNRRGVRGRYGARWYTASVRAFLNRRSVVRPVS